MLSFFLDIVEITVGISLLVLVMLLVLKLFGGKFTSRCRYVLWTLVLLRLAIPFSFNILPSIIEIPIHSVVVGEEQNEVVEDPTQNEMPPQSDELGSTSETPDTTLTPGTTNPTNPGTTTTPTYPTTPVNPTNPGTTTTPSNPTVPVNPSVPSVDVDEPIINDTPREEVSIPDPIPETPKEPISVIKILEVVSVIYLIGAVIFFCWNVFSYLLYTRRILKSARNADAKTIGIFLSICDKENLKKVPVLLVSRDINSPAAFGVFKRKVVLPDITFTQNGLAGTLFHEVVHCKRGDLYIKVIELVARSFHWFNPLSHIAAVRCEMEMEMSCDETVLDGCNDDARAAYGNVMLDIIRRCRRNKGALTTHFNPKKNSVKARFSNIINGSGSRRGKVLIPICLVLCIIAGTIVACTVGDKKQPDETDSPETDAVVELSVSLPDWEKTPVIKGTEIYNAASDGESFLVAITSNIDVENVKITKLIATSGTNFKFADCVPLHLVDMTAGEPIYVEVSVPGVIGTSGITYTDTDGTVKRFEISTSGEDGSPILIEITQDRLTEYFKASDLLAGEIEEYKLLIKDNNSEASLYYYYNGIESDFATKFRISADGHELDITTSLPAWLTNTWEPQIYRSNVTSDGGDRLFLIFTTGTGTGVHIEEAYVMNCFEGEIYAVPNPYDWVESVVSRGEDGKAWTVNSSGDKIELPDNAYFDQNFDFFVKNGKLYAKVLIGYGTWQYTEDYFLIEYGYNASGKIIAKSIKHSSEVDESFESTNLPRDFVNTYHTAEYFYAIFNGCARIEFYEETIEYEGEKYRNCSHVEFSNLAEMRNVLVRYFSDDITNSLMSKTVSGIGCPLYIEQDGKLYIFAGYAAQWGYNSATGYSFEPLGYENDEYLVRVSASINEYGVKYVAGDVCKYVIEADGSIRFTQFPLMIDLLWDAFAGEEEDVTPDSPVNVLSNPGGLKFSTITIPQNWDSVYEFDSEHIIIITYDVETGERGRVTATTNIRFYLVNTVRGELVATLDYGRAEGYLTTRHYEQDALVLYALELNEETETYSVPAAIRIEYKNGKLIVTETEKSSFPHHEEKLTSPDGSRTVYKTTDDGRSHGGIDVLYPDGTTKRILTNIMLDDPGVQGLGGVTGYSPIQFIDNDRLLYHIGGWEWTQGYGIYNLATGEKTEFRNGYGAIGYMDGYIYLRESSGYETVAWHKATLDGEIEKIASVNEESVIYVPNAREFKLGDTEWRDLYYASSYASTLDKSVLNTTIYSPDFSVIASVNYDCTDKEIYVISHGNMETAIVFDKNATPPEIADGDENTTQLVMATDNPKGYSIQTVYIPMGEGGRSSAYPYSDSQMLYMTFDLVTDAQGVTQAYSNIKLYLVDKERGRIVSECAIDGEYQLNTVSYDPTGNGVVLMDVEYSHDSGYIVHGAYHVLYSGGELTATKVESAAYPQHYMPVRGNSWDGLVYACRTTDDGQGRGGIDLTMPDGTVKRILTNVVLDDAGGNLSNVMYYTPVGVIGATVDENAKLVYNIGAYEGAGKGFGIYDIATGEREEFIYMNYRSIDVWSNSIYFEEYKRTDEGYSESYRIWKRDRAGNMTLLWSNDPDDGEAYHESKPFPSFKNGLWYFYSYPDIEVPSYINSSGYAKTEICHGDNFDPIVTVLYPYTVDRYSSNLLVTTSGRATVVLRVPEQVIPPSVTTVKFSTIEELIEKFGNEIDAFAPGYYARQEFLEAVDKFIDPAAHQDSMTKSEYAALAGMKLQDISATYDRSSGKMYLTFTVTGEPVGSLKKGKNTAEICENAYEGMGVMCGDTSGNNANEARSAVSKYIRWLGNDGMPENTWSGSYNFTDYMASCLNDIGKTPTRDLIVDYAARCFGLEGYSPLPSQFDASGNHVQLGYGLGVVNFIITGDKVEGVVHTVTVDIYRSSFYYDKYQTLNFHLTKLSDGAWKFIDITVAADGNEGVFKSILANQTPIYLATSKKEKLLSEFLDGTVYSLKKYTILDLDGDGRVEMVLWIVRYTNDYVGFLVLHREGDVVYAHELPYRGMTGLKSDGTFSFSSGAADSGIGKIEFSGDTFSVIKLAYSESEMTKNTRYYIDDKPVSQESFDAYWDSHSLFKLDAEWIEYDGGGGTVTTFSTVDELVAAYGETEILDRVLYGGAYSIDDLRFAVNSFLDPRKYREEIGETKYYARDGLGIKDPTLTYDRENGKIYLNFTAVGEPIGTLKLGENTCAVQVGVNGIYVACGEWIAVDTDAKATLSRYLSSTGIYGMPDITNSSDKSGLTRYMIQSLTETGIIPTKNAIQDYARECFYLENFDPGDWPVVNGVYQEPAMGGLDFPYLIVDEVEEGVIHYVTAHFYTDYSYEVIEREVTFILYDLGVKKFRFEGATEWKINGTNITVDVDNLATTMEIVEHAEMYPAEEYTVYVTGLSTPVTLFMRRDSVYKIEAFGHYLTTSEPHDMYGNCHHALFEVDGAIIFTWSYYSIGSNYIFTSKGCGQFDPAREDVSFLLYLDYMGNFKYRFTNKNEADIQQAVMYYVTTYNEFYYEVGDASIVDGTVVLGEIKEYNTIGEVYSLDGMFAKGKEDGLYAEYETIEDLFEANRKRREMSEHAANWDPEEFAAEIAKKSGSIVTAHGTPIGGWIHYYFPAILSSAQRITVYYTTDFGLSTYTTTAPLPEGVEFDYGKVVAAGSGAGSGECMFILRLEKDDGVTFWSYMNFADEEVNEFELLGEITRENVHRYGRTWAELLSLTSSIPLGFEPSSYKTEIELITGKEVLFWHKIFSNSVYLYFVPIEQGAMDFTVYAYKDYSMVINRNGEGLSKLKLTLPGDKQFDTAEPVWAGGGGGSGECRFVVKLTRGSEVTYVYYNNFHYETDILDFRYAGVVPDEDIEYFIEEYPEIFGNGEPHEHSFKTPAYYTTFQSSSNGKVYHNKYKDCGECGRAVHIEVVFCGYGDLERCNGGCDP